MKMVDIVLNKSPKVPSKAVEEMRTDIKTIIGNK